MPHLPFPHLLSPLILKACNCGKAVLLCFILSTASTAPHLQRRSEIHKKSRIELYGLYYSGCSIGRIEKCGKNMEPLFRA